MKVIHADPALESTWQFAGRKAEGAGTGMTVAVRDGHFLDKTANRLLAAITRDESLSVLRLRPVAQTVLHQQVPNAARPHGDCAAALKVDVNRRGTLFKERVGAVGSSARDNRQGLDLQSLITVPLMDQARFTF